MVCIQTNSVYVLIEQRISALGVQSILASEDDMEVLVLQADYAMNLQTISDFRPDVVITDASTCRLHSAAALARIKKSGYTRFLFLYSSADEAAEISAMGADAAISRSAPAESLAMAVRSLACGQVWLDEKIWSARALSSES